ncbi:MAG: hypothetical protein V1750_09725 [Acidobacteriota bacterium]
MGNESGSGLIDTLVCVALLGVLMAIVLPNGGALRRRADLEGVARQVISDAARCRAFAINSQRRAGLVFTKRHGKWSYNGVVDGDGDGVSRKDLARGVDRQLFPTMELGQLCVTARLGVPAGWNVPDPSGRGRLRAGDGLRAGTAAMISFSPLGEATPASLYIHDGQERMLALRVYGASARVRVLEWRRGWPQWQRLSL